MSKISTLRRRINAHVKAQIALNNSGSLPPDERPTVEREAVRAKKRMNEAISSIELHLTYSDW